MTASATRAPDMLTAAGDFGFIDLDQSGERIAVRCHPAVTQLGADRLTHLYKPRASWRCSCKCRDAVGMGRHQIGPKPGLPAAALNGAGWCRLTEVCRWQPVDSRSTAWYATFWLGHCRSPHIAIVPARFEQVPGGRLIWKVQLKLDQRARKGSRRPRRVFGVCSYADALHHK